MVPATEETDKLGLWAVHKLKENQFDPTISILDVRKETDWEKSHVEGAPPCLPRTCEGPFG